MLTYLVLAGNDGAPVSPELIARFTRDDPVDVPFRPDERIAWRNRDGSVVFLGWQAFTEVAEIGSHWIVSDQGLTAFSGHCWPHSTGWTHGSGRTWAHQLADWLAAHSDDPARHESLFGHFTLISLGPDGTGSVQPDIASIDQMFMAESSSVAAISNRAGLCARAVTHPSTTPTRSLMGAGWLIAEGWMLDEESSFWDVQRPGTGSSITIEPGRGARLVQPARPPFLPPDPHESFATYADLLDACDQALRESLRAIAALPIAGIELGLSGGKDSRTLTALILDEGLQDRFRFVTNGSPERADVIAARRIAERFQLDWRIADASQRSMELELANVQHHASLREGMNNAWSTFASPSYAPEATLSGVLGEMLRWGPVSMTGLYATSVDDMVDRVQRRRPLDLLGVLRPEIRDYYRQSQRDRLRALAEYESSFVSVSTVYYHEVLAQSRNGPDYSWSPRLSINPYLNPVCLRANHRLPPEQRPDLRFHADLQRRCSIELSKLPFAESTWSDASIAHLPDAADYAAIEPIVSASPDGRTWRQKHYADYRPMLERYLLDPDNPIQELLIRDRLVDRIATGGEHPGRTRLLWGALTAAVWIGDHERHVRLERA